MKYIPLRGGAIAELSMHFVPCCARGQNSHIKFRVILCEHPRFNTPARKLNRLYMVEFAWLASHACRAPFNVCSLFVPVNEKAKYCQWNIENPEMWLGKKKITQWVTSYVLWRYLKCLCNFLTLKSECAGQCVWWWVRKTVEKGFVVPTLWNWSLPFFFFF